VRGERGDGADFAVEVVGEGVLEGGHERLQVRAV